VRPARDARDVIAALSLSTPKVVEVTSFDWGLSPRPRSLANARAFARDRARDSRSRGLSNFRVVVRALARATTPEPARSFSSHTSIHHEFSLTGARVSARSPVVLGRNRKGMRVVAAVKDAAAPARYEALFLMKPGVEDSVRAAEVDKLRSMFAEGGSTEFEVTDRGLVTNAYEIKGFADSHQYMIHVNCPRGTVKKVQDELAKPLIGAEEIILRYMFFKE
jgi:small subunit ribosomal protein S6